MKKVIICLISSLLFVANVKAVNVNDEYGDWNTICPLKYANANYRETNDKAIIAGQIMCATIILCPFGGAQLLGGELNKRTGNYWAHRRKKYYTTINTCEQIQDRDSRQLCYVKVREMEDYLNVNERIYLNERPTFFIW